MRDTLFLNQQKQLQTMYLLIENIRTKKISRFMPEKGDGLAINIDETDRPWTFKFCRDGVGPAYTPDGLEAIPCGNFSSIASVLEFLSKHFGITFRYNEEPSSEIRRWFTVRTTTPPRNRPNGRFCFTYDTFSKTPPYTP